MFGGTIRWFDRDCPRSRSESGGEDEPQPPSVVALGPGKTAGKPSRNFPVRATVRQAARQAAESTGMPQAAATLFLVSLLVASGKTAQSLTSNGDTALIILQTAVCVTLLAAAVLCKNLRRAGVD
jgi:hypothetical protein